MNKFVKIIIYALIFLLVIFLGLVLFTQLVYAQEPECVLVFDDDDDPGFYDEFSYTDPQGREVCKVRVVFHQPAPGDPNGAVFTESGSINGYTANFNGASVHVWRSGSPYSISHTRVWVLEAAPPPTEIPPTEIPPTTTDIPPTEATPPTATATLPPGVTPTATPTLPPGVTPTITPTLIPPVTNMPSPTPDSPDTTPGQPGKTQVPMLPQTGFGEMTDANLGLWFGAGLLLGLLALFIHIVRAR